MSCFPPDRRPGWLPVAVVFGGLLTLPAQAHHVVDITTLQPTAINGLISGLAHPVLGPDHLLFLLALSLVGVRGPTRWMLLLLVAGLAGSGAGLLLPGLPGAELLVAGTLALVAGVLLGWLPNALLLPAMALHGYVLSEAVLGWTTMPLFSYFTGLLISQGLLLLLALGLMRPLAARINSGGRRWLALALVGVSIVFGLATELG
ncbi:MAG: HupE/UreJ family protein [Cyanobacteria bacterium]|nr:HupE/UreJ family protein [Cyanobacteriota bacterium]